jgi:AcrR family transcriptional regulator
MMPVVAKRYGGVEAADRISARRERLLAEGLALLGTEGGQACTVRAICQRAKLTPRYFYESFADLDALLLALFDELSGTAARHVLEAVTRASDDARAKARAAIGAFVEYVTEDPRRARVLFVAAIGSEQLARRRFATVRMFAELVVAEAQAFYRIPGTPDPLVRTTALMLAGGLAETLLAWIDGTLELTREQLIEDCADLFVATGAGAVRLVESRSRPSKR